MDVSVIIPTRNRSGLLAMTLHSVLRQQGVDLEVIVVDEASTDDTPAILAAPGDPRVRVIRHDVPRGVAAARNHGGADALGEWITFLDDDDLWAPDKLVQQLRAARDGGRDWAYVGAVNFIDDFRILYGRPPLPPDEVVAALPHHYAIPGGGSNVLVRKAMWLRAGPFDTRLRNTEDWEMCIRLSKLGPPAWVCSPLVARRLHRSNSSLDMAEIVKGTKLIETLHDTSADWGILHRWMAESSLRNGQRWDALGHLAKAALHGQARMAASDLNGVLRGRVRRTLRRRAVEDVSPNPWIEMAAAWMKDLRQA
jgi:glycosyltransferase involved in cell wall biosynthesis